MFPKAMIVIGIICAVLYFVLLPPELPIMNEANEIRQHGYRYIGAQEMSIEEYESIKEYDGFHGGKVEIVELQPLTIEYYFGSFDYINFLSQKPFGWGEIHIIPLISNIIVYLLFLLPYPLIASGIVMTFMERRKARQSV